MAVTVLRKYLNMGSVFCFKVFFFSFAIVSSCSFRDVYVLYGVLNIKNINEIQLLEN